MRWAGTWLLSGASPTISKRITTVLMSTPGAGFGSGAFWVNWGAMLVRYQWSPMLVLLKSTITSKREDTKTCRLVTGIGAVSRLPSVHTTVIGWTPPPLSSRLKVQMRAGPLLSMRKRYLRLLTWKNG